MYVPSDPPPPPRRRYQAPPNRRPAAPSQQSAPKRSTPPASLPIVRAPRWFKTLVRAQQLTTVVALGAVGAALGTYALTVYQWQAWNKAERQLAELRYQERSLQRSGAALEASLAADAERSSLVLWNPKQTLFVKAAPVPKLVTPAVAEPPSLSLLPSSEVPLAY